MVMAVSAVEAAVGTTAETATSAESSAATAAAVSAASGSCHNDSSFSAIFYTFSKLFANFYRNLSTDTGVQLDFCIVSAMTFNVALQSDLLFVNSNFQLCIDSFCNLLGSNGTKQFAVCTHFCRNFYFFAFQRFCSIHRLLFLNFQFMLFCSFFGFHFVYCLAVRSHSNTAFDEEVLCVTVSNFYHLAFFTGTFYILSQNYFHTYFLQYV